MEKVLGIQELAEDILSRLPAKDLLLATRVNKQWRRTITSSTTLRRSLFLEHSLTPSSSRDRKTQFHSLLSQLRGGYSIRVCSIEDDTYVNSFTLPDGINMKYKAIFNEWKLTTSATIIILDFNQVDITRPWHKHSYSKMHFWKTKIADTTLEIMNPDANSYDSIIGFHKIAVKVDGDMTIGQALDAALLLRWAMCYQRAGLRYKNEQLKVEGATAGDTIRPQMKWDQKLGWAWEDFVEEVQFTGLFTSTPRVWQNRGDTGKKMMDRTSM